MTTSLLALERNARWVANAFTSWAGLSREIYFQHRVEEYRRLWQRVAAQSGATFSVLAPDLWQIDRSGSQVRIRNHELEFDDPVTLALAGRKPVVHRLLGAAGIQVPEHVVFSLDRLQVGRTFADQHPGGTVVKPANGYGGRGVTTHVRRGEVDRAAVRAAVHDGELLIERMVPGESYRILVLEGRVIDAVRRAGPRVIGDGASTVRQLIEDENARRAAARRPALALGRDAHFALRHQKLALNAVPDAGRAVVVGTSEAQGGRYADVRTVYTDPALDQLHPSIRDDAESAARLVGSDFLGVDVITPDPSVPLRDSGGVINEVNTTPALHHHYDLRREPYPSVAIPILEALLRRSSIREVARRGQAGSSKSSGRKAGSMEAWDLSDRELPAPATR